MLVCVVIMDLRWHCVGLGCSLEVVAFVGCRGPALTVVSLRWPSGSGLVVVVLGGGKIWLVRIKYKKKETIPGWDSRRFTSRAPLAASGSVLHCGSSLLSDINVTLSK